MIGIALLLLLAHGQSQNELNEAACAKYKEADREMNQMYEQVLRQYQSDTVFIPKLRAAQRAWAAFRDAHLAALYPKTAPGSYGSVNAMCRCAILTELTEARTHQLKEWADGTQEADVCAGSIKINR